MWTSLIAFDIETDTSELTNAERAAGWSSRGLDPAITPITTIAIARPGHDPLLLNGDERQLLTELDALLRTSPPGLLVTWNGAVFDLPFVQDRAARHGLTLGLQLDPNPLIVPKHDPTPGHAGGYTAAWASSSTVPHAHLDIAYALKEYSWRTGTPWALKPVARSLGMTPIEVDRSRMHHLAPQELLEYAASDATITLQVAQLLLDGRLGH